MAENLSKEERRLLLKEIMNLDAADGLRDINDRIKNSNYYKFDGIAPEGFMLIPNEVIELLDDFEEWKDFKYRKFEWLAEKSKSQLKVK